MTDRDLIKALRYCAEKGICDDCPVQNESIDERMCCDDYLNLLAADRMEELRKASVIDIVRCDECKYAEDFDEDDAQYAIGRICMYAADEDYTPMRWVDDFCSYGDRREDSEVD